MGKGLVTDILNGKSFGPPYYKQMKKFDGKSSTVPETAKQT